jgi:hypothetical protein
MNRMERTKKFMSITKIEPGKKIKLKNYETGWVQRRSNILGKGTKGEADKL